MNIEDNVSDWPINRLIKESSSGECKVCGSTVERKYWIFGKKKCIHPKCPTNKAETIVKRIEPRKWDV